MVSPFMTRDHRPVPEFRQPSVISTLPLSSGRENLMTSKTSHLTCRTRRAVILTLTVALLGGFSGRVAAQSKESASKDSPVGAWAIQVTLRDCATGAPLGPAFNSLVTFHRGGTLSESAGGTAFAPGQRSPGHGVWTRIGHDTYLQRFVAMLLFTDRAKPARRSRIQSGLACHARLPGGLGDSDTQVRAHRLRSRHIVGNEPVLCG